MIQNFLAFNTTFKKVSEKQATFRSASGKEKQLDYVFIDKRSRRYRTDAETNDMIHMESDHRSFIAHLRFPRGKKERSLEQWRSE